MGPQRKDFGAVSQMDLTAAQARLEQDQILKKCLKLNTLFNGFKVYTDW